jgi:hypothetical protein
VRNFEVLKIFVAISEGKRPLDRPWHRREDNIKTEIISTGCKGRDWIQVAQDRDQWRVLVKTVTNLRVPQKAGKFLTS